MSEEIKNYAASMYIGTTSGTLPRPVFFDPHLAAFNNKPPVTIVTGTPGSGKTFFGLGCSGQSSILGKTTIILDPKGDFLQLLGIKDDIGDLSIWNLGKTKGRRAGVLDPFYMSNDPGATLSLVLSVLDLFTGGLSESQMTALSPIVKDVIDLPVPSLMKVVDHLRRSEREVARDLGTKLDVISRMPGAKLCFAPGGSARESVSIDRGTTIITLVGMDLPADAEAAKSTNQGRLMTGLLFLITDFIYSVMHNSTSTNPKLVIIDEARSVVSSKHGADVIKNLALLGRSKGIGVIMMTQSMSHLSELDIENTVSSRFAFKTSRKEADEIAKAMNLPENYGYEERMMNLKNGECFYQDVSGRVGTIQISSWNNEWTEAFRTNPYELMVQRKREEKRKQLAQERKTTLGGPQSPGQESA